MPVHHPETVRNHVTRIYSKLQVDGRPQAIVLARELGLDRGNIGASRCHSDVSLV